MEQLEFNLLFRWFVGVGIDDRVWDATVFTKTRHRGLARVDWQFTLALAAYDLIRLPNLLRAAACPPRPGAGPPSGALSRRCRGRQGFPSAGPHRCAEIRHLVPSERIDPTDTVMPKVAHKNPDSARSSATC